MGYPIKDELIDVLKEMFTEKEAEVALAIPTGVGPLQPTGVDDIFSQVKAPEAELIPVLESLEKSIVITETAYPVSKLGLRMSDFFTSVIAFHAVLDRHKQSPILHDHGRPPYPVPRLSA
jgi:hypothetical protein